MRSRFAWLCVPVLAASCGGVRDGELFRNVPVQDGLARESPGPIQASLPAATAGGETQTPGEGNPARDEAGLAEDPGPGTSASGVTPSSGSDAGGVDAVVDADVTEPCSLTAFGAPELVAGLQVPVGLDLWAPSLSADGLTLIFGADQPGVNEHIFVATRTSRDAAFSAASLLNGINSDASEGTPFSSTDGLTLYFYSTREGGQGDRDLWTSSRAAPDAAFTTPVLLGGVGSPAADHLPWISANELSLLFASARGGDAGDVWAAQRTARAAAFSSPAPLEEINTNANEGRAVLSNDGLTIIFASDREGGQGTQDLWMATRETSDARFAPAVNLVALNSPALDQDPFLSADGTELLFASSRGDQSALYRAIRTCD
jgi:hypothetical protein